MVRSLANPPTGGFSREPLRFSNQNTVSQVQHRVSMYNMY